MSWAAITSVNPSHVQDHAFNMVRNLVHGGVDHARAVVAWAADEGNPGSGAANLLAALAAPLQPDARSAPSHREHSLYAVCNICAGEGRPAACRDAHSWRPGPSVKLCLQSRGVVPGFSLTAQQGPDQTQGSQML